MIYLLHNDPAENAKMLADRDLDLQIREIAQTLCNVHHCYAITEEMIAGIPLKRQKTSARSISSFKLVEYARTCRANYLKLVEMACECCNEYVHRFTRDLFKREKEHELQAVVEWCALNVPFALEKDQVNIFDPQYKDWMTVYSKQTPFPICMPAKYIEYLSSTVREGQDKPVDVVQSYRNYYRAKLQKKFKCKGDDCEDGWIFCFKGQEDECKYFCKKCDGEGRIAKPLKYTRREIPTFLK